MVGKRESPHSIETKDIAVTVYIPAPAVIPIIPHAQSAAEVVSPFIWLLELYKTEFPLIIAPPITTAADKTGKLTEVPDIIKISVSIAIVPARETIINVRKPAE